MGTSFWISSLLFFTTLVSWGQALRDPAGLPVPENDEARLALRRVITAPLGEVLESEARQLTLRGGPLAVRFRVETQNGSVYLLFLNERASGFPVHGSGSAIIRRSRTDGSFQQMKIFYRDPASHRAPPRDPRLAMDSGSFVRITPEGGRSEAGRSRMDVYLFDRRLYAAVVLPVPFESLLTAPFERIRRLSAGTVDWPLLLERGDAPSSARTLALLERLRPLLPSLRVEEDGALDADGRFVHIADPAAGVEPGGFNCSGFAKWVVDGFYGPLAGGYLPVAGVKARFGEHAGNRWNAAFERQREPYFGLDWSRSLAALLSEAGGSGDGSAAVPRAATGAAELPAPLCDARREARGAAALRRGGRLPGRGSGAGAVRRRGAQAGTFLPRLDQRGEGKGPGAAPALPPGGPLSLLPAGRLLPRPGDGALRGERRRTGPGRPADPPPRRLRPPGAPADGGGILPSAPAARAAFG